MIDTLEKIRENFNRPCYTYDLDSEISELRSTISHLIDYLIEKEEGDKFMENHTYTFCEKCQHVVKYK